MSLDYKAISFCLDQGLKVVQKEISRVDKLGNPHGITTNFMKGLKELEGRIKELHPDHFLEINRDNLEDKILQLKYRGIVDGDAIPEIMSLILPKKKKKRAKKS